MSFIFFISLAALSLSSHLVTASFRYEAFLEAEPIHPTFALEDLRPDRQDDSSDDIEAPQQGCVYRKKLQLADFGTIKSPNYPKHYPSMQNCEWILESPPGTRIASTVFDLFTQPWFFSFFDYILISRNGDFTDAERLFGDMNGKTPMTIVSKDNKFGIRFHSSTYFNFRGFKLQYLVRPSTRQVSFGEPIYLDGVCGRSFLLNSGNSATPNNSTTVATTTTTSTSTTSTVSTSTSEATTASPTEGSSRWKTNSKYAFPYIGSGVDADGKIFGGVPTKAFAYPWMAALLIDGRNFCGASLIDNQHIITAAHCTDGARLISVLLGSHNLKVPKSTEPSRMVINVTRSAIFQHPDYNRRSISHDISIIRLPKPLVFTKEIQPVCLPNKYFLAETFENSPVRVSGWGKSQDRGGSISAELQHVGVSVMSNVDCRKVFRGIITGNIVCVETKQRQSPCKGDSGGPLMLLQKGPQGEFFMQVGIVSFGSSSCQKGQPVGFTRITAFFDFIAKVTGRKAE